MGLDKRVEAIEERLKKIESRLGVVQETSVHEYHPPKKQAPDPTMPLVTNNISSMDSSSLLSYIGIAFVVLAGLFLIKMSVDSGWLTPSRQILFAGCLGVLFLTLPYFFSEKTKAYLSLLAGAGTAILHLTWLGAYSYHNLIEADVALLSATAVGIISVALNIDQKGRSYLLIAMAGTYLSAPSLGYQLENLQLLAGFFLIWNVCFSLASLLNKRRDVMIIASYFAVFTILMMTRLTKDSSQAQTLLALQGLQFLIFAGAQVLYSSYYKSPMSKEESHTLLPLLLLFYFSTMPLAEKVFPVAHVWFGIIVGLAVLAAYSLARHFLQRSINSGVVLVSFATLVIVHSGFFKVLDDLSQPMVALLIGGLLMLNHKYNYVDKQAHYWPLLILSFVFVYGGMQTILSPAATDYYYFYNWLYGLFALVLVASSRADKEATLPAEKSSLVLIFAHIEIMLGLYLLSKQLVMSGALFVTISWGLYALAILYYASRKRDYAIGKSALTILFLVSLKAFFYDVANTTNLVRVGCLLLEGLLLYWCGWYFKKMQSWDSNKSTTA